MGVFVRVEVRDGDARGLNFTNLRDRFAFHFAGCDAAAQQVHHEPRKAGTQASFKARA